MTTPERRVQRIRDLADELASGASVRDDSIVEAFRSLPLSAAGLGMLCAVLHHRPGLTRELLREFIGEQCTFGVYTAQELFERTNQGLCALRSAGPPPYGFALGEDGERFLRETLPGLADLVNDMIAEAWRLNWGDELDPALFDAHQSEVIRLERELAQRPEELARRRRALKDEFEGIYSRDE